VGRGKGMTDTPTPAMLVWNVLNVRCTFSFFTRLYSYLHQLTPQHPCKPCSLPSCLPALIPPWVVVTNTCLNRRHGTMTRGAVEELLKGHGGANGLFVVWEPPSNNEVVLSVCYAGMVFHNPCRKVGRGLTNAYGTFFGNIGCGFTLAPRDYTQVISHHATWLASRLTPTQATTTANHLPTQFTIASKPDLPRAVLGGRGKRLPLPSLRCWGKSLLHLTHPWHACIGTCEAVLSCTLPCRSSAATIALVK